MECLVYACLLVPLWEHMASGRSLWQTKHPCRYLHRLGEAWFLHLTALKERQFLNSRKGGWRCYQKMRLLIWGTKELVDVCTVCCHVTWLAACIAGDRGCRVTCGALSRQVMVDRVSRHFSSKLGHKVPYTRVPCSRTLLLAPYTKFS